MEQLSSEQVDRVIRQVQAAATEYAIQYRQTAVVTRAAEGQPLAFPKELDAAETSVITSRRGHVGLLPIQRTRTDAVMRIELAAYERIRMASRLDSKLFQFYPDQFRGMIEGCLQERSKRGSEYLLALGEMVELPVTSDLTAPEASFIDGVRSGAGINYNLAPFVHNMIGVHEPMYQHALDVVHSAYAKLDFFSAELVVAMPSNAVQL